MTIHQQRVRNPSFNRHATPARPPLAGCAALLLTAVLWIPAAHAAKVWPHNVTQLVVSPRVCTTGAKGVYQYSASWTPATWNNQPWQRYNVVAHNCTAGPVSCTPTRCTVQATGCRTRQPGPWIAVQADVGQSISSVRADAAPPSLCQ
ncbi:MAG: hypothetical protein K2X51_15910 [Burkholderiales bacterium]|nr:hypothetical protein [Burkholderiales bacterium]